MKSNYFIQDDLNLNEAIIKSPFGMDAFKLTDSEKIAKIEFHFTEIMHALGLNLHDDSLKDTPNRVAKMYVNETFSGLNPNNKPAISLFENSYGYNEMLIEKDITLYSTCEHHFVPIIGKVHVAYIPDKQVIGLSKINRLVQYFAKRPQVQERLTIQILDALKDILQHDNVAVVIEADHLCVASRGIKDTNSITNTACYAGQFNNEATKQAFLLYLYKNK